ncbi:hypothetical protein COCNU_scaffold001335G000010 [Cocos nucifera]|nr:hypothetical protein [Cocos nucifera]
MWRKWREKEISWVSLEKNEDEKKKWIRRKRGGEGEVADEKEMEMVGATMERDMDRLGEEEEEGEVEEEKREEEEGRIASKMDESRESHNGGIGLTSGLKGREKEK